MANSVGALDFGSGLAQGLAEAFGQDRAHKNAMSRDSEARKMALGQSVLQHVMQSGRVADYNDLMPYMDLALGTGGAKPKKGEINPHDILSMVLQPALAGQAGSASSPAGGGAGPAGAGVLASPAAAPGGDLAGVVAAMGQPRANASTAATPLIQPTAAPAQAPPASTPGSGNAAASAAGAAGAAAPAGRPGLKILSDAELIERQTSNEALTERARITRQTQLARDVYAQFKDLDADFTLYDALAAVGLKTDFNRQYSGTAGSVMRGLDAQIQRRETELGRPLTADEALEEREKYFATNRAGGVDRESLSRAKYGVAFVQLTPEQAAEVNREAEALVGNRAYSRTASSAAADFNKQLTPTQAQQTNLPVGTTGPQVAGQQVLTAPEIEARRSTEGLRDTLVDIRDRLIDPALPGKDELGGLLPGAALALRRRSPEGRESVAALEAAVNNVVNVVARTVAQQRGAQTEMDAKRAEAAIVSLKDAIISGDTRESAKVRINESLKIIEDVLTKLPQQAVPQAKPGASASGTGAAAAPAAGGSFSVDYQGQNYSFASQAALDTFKRGLGIK